MAWSNWVSKGSSGIPSRKRRSTFTTEKGKRFGVIVAQTQQVQGHYRERLCGFITQERAQFPHKPIAVEQVCLGVVKGHMAEALLVSVALAYGRA
jgi:hypothetical protein